MGIYVVNLCYTTISMKNMLSCEIWSILKTSHGNALLLKPKSMDVAVPIFIGTLEMQSIIIGKEGMKLQRPHTHDLFLNMLANVNLSVKRVEIYELKDDVFHARLIITGGEFTQENPLVLESRPSDAFAISTRKKCPIYLTAPIIRETGVPLDFFIGNLDDEDPADTISADYQSGDILSEDRYQSLREQLEQAVAEEEYEQAAEIRDLLRLLEDNTEI